MRNCHNKAILTAFFCALAVTPGRAQFLGFMAGQTVSQSFSVNAGTPTPHTIFNVRDFGQVGHSITVTYTLVGGGGGCTTWLEGSMDNTYFVLLAAVPQTNLSVNKHQSFGVGWWPFVRVEVNPLSAAACQASVSGNYTGFQAPIPPNPIGVPLRVGNIAANVDVLAAPSIVGAAPSIIRSMNCYNPNASTAFVQISDSATIPGGLGQAQVVWEVGIPATSNAPFPHLDISISSHPWIGAATTLGGNVAVATGLVCSISIDYYGPFYPISGQGF